MMEEALSSPTTAASGPHQHDSRPNKELTYHERMAKQDLKKQLKKQHRRKRLEAKLRHAVLRNDDDCVAKTRAELKAVLQEQSMSMSEIQQVLDNPGRLEATPDRVFLTELYSELQKQTQNCHNNDGNNKRTKSSNSSETRERQIAHSIFLLKHMTKGTQQIDMFSNPDALWGYTRQKFFERAMLVRKSFQKLSPDVCLAMDLLECERSLSLQIWRRLQTVRKICSIGCGPGNDVAGVVAFFKTLSSVDCTRDSPTPTLEQAVLLDWAIAEWSVILEPFRKLMVPTHVQLLETGFCDMAHPLSSDCNQSALHLITDTLAAELNGCESHILSLDLVLISYLLTEVRGRWEPFMKELVQLARPGTLFYFAEPTPWQLHLVKKLLQDDVDLLWVDSSMDRPELQPLEKRVGPGVLMGLKR